MGKLYTIDGKLLTDTPEIRIGEKIYPVDDRTKTVKRLMKIQKEKTGESTDIDLIDEAVKLALGEKAFISLNTEEIPFKAYQSIFETIMSAMVGEDPESEDSRFQKGQ